MGMSNDLGLTGDMQTQAGIYWRLSFWGRRSMNIWDFQGYLFLFFLAPWSRHEHHSTLIEQMIPQVQYCSGPFCCKNWNLFSHSFPLRLSINSNLSKESSFLLFSFCADVHEVCLSFGIMWVRRLAPMILLGPDAPGEVGEGIVRGVWLGWFEGEKGRESGW